MAKVEPVGETHVKWTRTIYGPSKNRGAVAYEWQEAGWCLESATELVEGLWKDNIKFEFSQITKKDEVAYSPAQVEEEKKAQEKIEYQAELMRRAQVELKRIEQAREDVLIARRVGACVVM